MQCLSLKPSRRGSFGEEDSDTFVSQSGYDHSVAISALVNGDNYAFTFCMPINASWNICELKIASVLRIVTA